MSTVRELAQHRLVGIQYRQMIVRHAEEYGLWKGVASCVGAAMSFGSPATRRRGDTLLVGKVRRRATQSPTSDQYMI